MEGTRNPAGRDPVWRAVSLSCAQNSSQIFGTGSPAMLRATVSGQAGRRAIAANPGARGIIVRDSGARLANNYQKLKGTLAKIPRTVEFYNRVGVHIAAVRAGRRLWGKNWHFSCLISKAMGLVSAKRDITIVGRSRHGTAFIDQTRPVHGFGRAILRLAAVGFVASGLGACAVGSMGAMLNDGPDAIASLGAGDTGVNVSEERIELANLAEELQTPVWHALDAAEAPQRNRGINFGSMVGILLTGADASPDVSADQPSDAERYLASLNSIFDQPSDLPLAVAVDVFRKNSQARQFVSVARDVVAGHDRPVSVVNAAYQAGEIDLGTYRAELAGIDADRRVLSSVVTSMREQRRTFARVRTLIAADQPEADLSRLDTELASLTQYEDMVTRLSAQLAGEVEAGS